MRSWVWLLPCWVWRMLFLRAAKQWVRLDGYPRRALRLDSEFMLIYDPEQAAGAAACAGAGAPVPTQIGATPIVPRRSPKTHSPLKLRDDLRRDLGRSNTALMLRALETSERPDDRL